MLPESITIYLTPEEAASLNCNEGPSPVVKDVGPIKITIVVGEPPNFEAEPTLPGDHC